MTLVIPFLMRLHSPVIQPWMCQCLFEIVISNAGDTHPARHLRLCPTWFHNHFREHLYKCSPDEHHKENVQGRTQDPIPSSVSV